MSRIGKIARRTFLVTSVAIAGGVAFGYYAYRRPMPNPLLDDLAEGEVAITPYVLIDGDGVTIITPRTDLGQGSYSVLAALVAEELDIAWSDIRVDPGPASGTYYNTKVAAEGLPFAATDDGFMARSGRVVGDAMGKFIGLNITGGSSTVPDGYEKMRRAGAVARETLLLAAARQTGADRATLTTENGAVVLPDGTRLPYPDLAATAATIDPPDEVALRPDSAWRYLGQKMQRIDIVPKSTGTQTYGIDIDLPGMVFATVRTNPRIGGGMTGFDAKAAEASPGVLRVVPVDGGAAVVATSTWRAMRAADLVTFDWGPAPYPATSAEMWDRLSASFTDDLRDSRFRNDGDVGAALAGGDVVEAEYRMPYLAHAPLEPMNATALFQDGRLDIWTATQIPTFARDAAAGVAGIDAGAVHIHNQYAGGSFGRRLEDDFVRQTVAVAAAMPGTPVKLTWSREEDMSHDFPRPMAMARARGQVRDGRVKAFDLALASASVTQSQTGRLNQFLPGPDVAIVAGAWDQPFAIPDYRVTGYRAAPMVPISSWRSVGASVNGFMHDSFLDELCHAAGADPLAERIRLANHDLSRKVLEAVGEMSGWDGPSPGAGRGRGVAFCLSFGVPVAEVVEVTDTGSGIRIDRVFVAAEVGRVLDPVNFENQVMGGVIWGLGHAMNCELTYADGMPEQTNFDGYEGMRMHQVPDITVRGLENGSVVRGIGEPPVPPAAPALANAIFAATGQRIRELPLSKHIDFV
jgi:isoquinoline 1-oxidoreductase beta subunit